MAASVTTRSVERPKDPASIADAYLWARRDRGFAAWGEALRIEVGTGSDRFARAWQELAEGFASLEVEGRVPLAVGSFTFDPAASGSVLVVPDSVLHFDETAAWLTSIGDAQPPALAPAEPVDRVRYGGSTVPDHRWLDLVSEARRDIRRAELQKVVLARDVHVWSKQPFDQRRLLSRLRARFPGCYTFACDGLIGASPELLVKRDGDTVSSLVLAGSAARGVAEADAQIGADLLASEKDREEHDLAVASVTEVFGRLCDDVRAGEPRLLRLANVQHIATEVSGRLNQTLSALELAGELHPTAAVCGTPTEDALQAIRRLEGMDRGRYAGPVGWVDADGNGEWAIALRCAEVDGARGRMFAGAGVVQASEPEAELEETRLKLQAMMSVFD
jgi:menaquinone-specific isochorismate synthase